MLISRAGELGAEGTSNIPQSLPVGGLCVTPPVLTPLTFPRGQFKMLMNLSMTMD